MCEGPRAQERTQSLGLPPAPELCAPGHTSALSSHDQWGALRSKAIWEPFTSAQLSRPSRHPERLEAKGPGGDTEEAEGEGPEAQQRHALPELVSLCCPG